MDSDTHIVGIAGLPRSGKDYLAEKFIAEGYFGVSLGDIIRNESRVRHQNELDPISVANMTETANWLRAEHGPDFALQKALTLFYQSLQSGASHKGLVVWSIRAPVEADFVISHKGDLIWLEASDQTRYERAMEHLREGEAKISLAEFKAQEDLQWQPQPGLPPGVQMDISYVRQKATTVFENNYHSLGEFSQKAHELIASLTVSTPEAAGDNLLL